MSIMRDPELVEPALEKRAHGLASGFLRSLAQHPARPAVEVAGVTLTYSELAARARSLAATLSARLEPDARPPEEGEVVGVFAYRSPSAFAGILGSLLSGRGWVALSRSFPPQRTRLMIEKAELRALVVDEGSLEQLDDVFEGLSRPLLVLLPDSVDAVALQERWPAHTFVAAPDLEPENAWRPVSVDPESIAYLIFTSGSTGTPKAVTVLHRNVVRFVELIADSWQIDEHDRLSQTFDMTFDLSISDMFLAWERGACVCCLSQTETVKPAKFIVDSRLTIWYAVPSAGLLMRRFGMLKPGQYPGLRRVHFCGEPLPAELAQAWADAAPNAIVENVYGPTEATISCAFYEWDPERSPAECEHGVVPIGSMYPLMRGVVVDEGMAEVAPGAEGELLLVGPQVTAGYWRDPERTSAAFVPLAGEVHYRTGDLVRRPVGDGPIVYLGRIDHQVKITGHRVELGEIEAAIREASGAGQVVAVGWPKTESGYAGVAAFVSGAAVDPDAIRAALAEQLPPYMVPREIRLLEQMPFLVNGKVDRNALLELLEAAR
jgi:amino acid adenylation domain-containing protein